jgi:metallo-beta-lactamase family protein
VGLTLSFFGAAGTVTGSKYLLESGADRILVDCGLFQGFKNLRSRNWARFPVDPRSIDAVVLTHAHLDHSGYLPLLVKSGFRGPIYCTEATAELCGIMLPDSGHLEEMDAEFANRHGFSKHKPALPLYTEEDARRSLEQLTPAPFNSAHNLPGGGRFVLHRMGHILGAASIELDWQGRKVVFSGDVGRYGDDIMLDPATVEGADYLLVESTYGDRVHSKANPDDALAELVTRTLQRNGTVIIPAFAVGRAQSIIYRLERLKAALRLPPSLAMFLDSPMAIDASEIFCRHQHDHRLSPEACRSFAHGVRYVRDSAESKALTADPTPKIIISASGMATGGRVLHHLKHYAPDPRNSILFVGFQAGGTRGRAMVEGARSVKIHGNYVPVRAQVHNLDMLSAHADSDELLRWMRGFKSSPKQVFVTHGEPAASDALRRRIEEELHWRAYVPEQAERAELA